MKNQKTRVIALLLCVVLLISAMPLYSFATEAQDGYSYAETLGAKLGDNIYDHSFSELTDVPADWTVASGSAALGTAEQGGVTKAGYSISGANGSMNTVRIKVPAENYVVKLSMYQVTSYWGGDNGRVYVYKQGKNSGSDEYFENAHIELGGYKRTSWIPPANGASIYKYNADGTLNTSDIARVTDIGGGFGADGNSVLTLYIYSYNGINHYVTETGTLLASVSDAKAANENYFAIAGDYMRILLSDFEVYELVDPEASTDEYNYLDTLGAELGDNIYNHNFSELTDVTADWTVASGSAALGTAEQGGIAKAGYSISGANGSMNSVRIKIPAENYVVKLSMYQVTGYWGGDNGRVYIYKQGKNSGSGEYFENAQMQLGGYKRTSTLPPANGAAIYKYDENGATSNNTATVLADIGGGFGADGNSLLTLFIYSYNGTNYYVNESGTLLASVSDAKAAVENYFAIAGDYMRILLSDFEVYELTEQVISHDEYNYLDELDAVLGKNVYDHSFSELTDVPADWTVASGSVALGTAEQGGVTKAGYSISGANGSMNSVRIKIPAENYVVKLSMYQVTGYWGGDNGRVYVGKQGRTDGDEAYYDIAQMQIGGYKRTSFLPPANGAAIYRYDRDGNPVQSTVTRLTDIGGGFGADGNSEFTLFIYYYDGINYFVNEAGTLLGSSYDALVTEEQYITLAGDYMRILLSDFEIYELGDTINILDEINKAIDAEDAETFKALIKHKKSGIAYELITVDAEFMSALKSLKTAKGANLTAADIYQLSIVEVTDIGSRLELFVDDTLIDKNSTTAELVVMSPKYEGQILDLSGYFRCDDINNGVYTGSFDDSVINEDTRPWESLGSNEGGIVEVEGKYYYYYLGVDDGVVNADSYTGEGETDPVTYYFNVCVAVSEDGKTWTRPELGIYDFNYKGENLPNNIIISDIKENFGGGHIASFSAFKDTNPNADPDKPYKALMVVTKEKNWWGFNIYGLESSDGIHWEQINGGQPIMETASTECLDSQNIAFYSEKDQEYKFYFRLWQENEYFGRQRSIAVVTAKDFTNWNNIDEAPIIDFYSDKMGEELLEDNLGLDGVHPDEYQLYTNQIGIYDRAPHYYIGFPTRYLGDSTGYEVAPYLIAGRDGENFKFWNTMLIEPSAELGRDGNRSNYACGGPIRTGENEYSIFANRGFNSSGKIIDRFSFRVDGFVAAVGDESGKTVTTTPITFDGDRLILNYKAPEGTVRAQLTDLDGNVIEGFSFDDCTALTGDSIEQELVWTGDLSAIDQPVKLTFELTNAELYSYRFAEEVLDAGDVNKDGEIDVCDLVALSNMITDGTAEATPVNDLNGDGAVDKLDLAEIRKLIIS